MIAKSDIAGIFGARSRQIRRTEFMISSFYFGSGGILITVFWQLLDFKVQPKKIVNILSARDRHQRKRSYHFILCNFYVFLFYCCHN